MAAPSLVVKVAGNIDLLKQSMLEGVNTIQLTGAQLTRLSSAYDGSKVITQATATAAAIDALGGVTRLTEREMEKANALFADAAEKLAKMGESGAKGAAAFQSLADGTKVAEKQTSLFQSAAGKLAGAFTLAALARWTGELFEAAGHLQDISDRTGIGVQALQRFDVIAQQSGSSIDAVSTAVFQMNKRFLENKPAVTALGLDFEALKKTSPEARFNAIGIALGDLADPLAQADLGAKLFGRSVQELIPVFKQLKDEGGPVITMTEEQVALLDTAGDMWVKFKASIVPTTVALADHVFQISEFVEWVTLATGKNDGFAKSLEGATKAAMAAAPGFGALVPPGLPKDLDDINAKLDAQTEIAKKAAKEFGEYSEAWANLSVIGQDVKATADSVNDATRQQIEYYLQGGASVRDLAKAFPELTDAQIKAVDAMRKTGDVWQQTLSEISLATGGLQGVLNTIDGRVVDWAEHLLASGVSAKQVADYYGLTDIQVKALEQDLKTSAKAADEHAKADDKAAEAAGRLRAALDAAGQAALARFTALNSAVMGIDVSFQGWNNTVMNSVSMMDAIGKAADDTVTKVRTLSGQLISVADAQKLFDSGGSGPLQQFSDQEFQQVGGLGRIRQIEASYMTNPGRREGGTGSTGVADQAGWNSVLDERRLYAQLQAYAQSHHLPGFSDGGGVSIRVGERGPETLRVPLGSMVFPQGASGGSSIVVHNTINITQPLGSPTTIARAIDEAQMRSLRARGVKFTAGT